MKVNNMTIWKWFNNNYKCYSENFSVLKELKKFSKFQKHSEYFQNGKKIAEDYIFPISRLRQLEKLTADLGLKITFL